MGIRSAFSTSRLAYRAFFASDEMAAFQLLCRIGRVLLPRYRFQWPQLAWWENRSFNEYLARFGETGGHNTDRKWALYQLTRLTTHVPGATAECGVLHGASTYLICLANERARKPHHVFDSFEGLSAPGVDDGKHWKAGDLAVSEESVRKALAMFPQVVFHKGWIPERFGDVAGERFSFVHVDVDLAQPTLDSVAFFYSRLNPGAILLCDDYGFTSCPGATSSIDRFLADKPEKMISLSGGGGFLIKGAAAAPQFGEAPSRA